MDWMALTFNILVIVAHGIFSALAIAIILDKKVAIPIWQLALTIGGFSAVRAGFNIINFTIARDIWPLRLIAPVLTTVGTVIIALICFKANLKQALAAVALWIITLIAGEMIIFPLLVWLEIVVHADVRFYTLNWEIDVGMIAWQGFSIFIYRHTKNWLSIGVTKKGLAAIYGAIIIATLMYAQTIIWSMSSGVLTITDSLLMVVLGSFMLAFLLLVISHVKSKALHKLQQQTQRQNTTQEAYILQLVELHKQKQLMYHDFKNHANILYSLGKENKTEAMLSHLEKITDIYNQQQIVSTTNNMLDITLSAKILEARRLGIDFTLHMPAETDVSLLGIDLCVVLANGLDNAIEACQRSGQKNTFVDVEILTGNNHVLCSIKNTLGAPPKTKGKKFVTSKEDAKAHGLGIQSMRRNIANLGGSINFDWDDEVFAVYLRV